MKIQKKIIFSVLVFILILIASGGILFLISKHKVESELSKTYIYKDEGLAFYREPCNVSLEPDPVNIFDSLNSTNYEVAEKSNFGRCKGLFHLNNSQVQNLSVFLKNNQKNNIPCDIYFFDAAFTISGQFFIIARDKKNNLFVCEKIKKSIYGHVLASREFKAFDLVFKNNPENRFSKPNMLFEFYNDYYYTISCFFTFGCEMKGRLD